MNTKIKLAALSLILLATVSATVSEVQAEGDGLASVGQVQSANLGPIAGSVPNQNWHASFTPVPETLRIHVPELQSDRGLLVSHVAPHGPAASTFGLTAGDILLAVGNQDVIGMNSIPKKLGASIVVFRRGKVAKLQARDVFDAIGRYGTQLPLARQKFGRPGIGFGLFGTQVGGVSASAFSSGNESVSISQNGDQIDLQMSLPDLGSNSVRFQGTRESIVQQIEKSKLSPAAQARVMEAIR